MRSHRGAERIEGELASEPSARNARQPARRGARRTERLRSPRAAPRVREYPRV